MYLGYLIIDFQKQKIIEQIINSFVSTLASIIHALCG